MTNSKVSIIMTSFNYATFITQAINSVIAQTYDNWELIIVDDGSNDNSIRTIEDYTKKYPNIFLYTHKNNSNLGIIKSIQLGLKKSTGEYIAFLESDDYWDKKYLEEKVVLFDCHKDVGLIFNDVKTIGEPNRIGLLENYLNVCREIYKKLAQPSDISKYIFSINIIPTFSCWMSRKSLLENCDFNPKISSSLDFWLWTQIAYLTKSICINKKMSYWRLHSNSFIAKTKEQEVGVDIDLLTNDLLAIFKKSNPDKYKEFVSDVINYKLSDFKKDTLQANKQKFINSLKDKNVYLYGAGSYARNLIETNKITGLNIIGIIDGDIRKRGTSIHGYKIWHKDDLNNLEIDVLILCLAEPDLVYYDLLSEMLNRKFKIQIITGFFDNQNKELAKINNLINSF